MIPHGAAERAIEVLDTHQDGLQAHPARDGDGVHLGQERDAHSEDGRRGRREQEWRREARRLEAHGAARGRLDAPGGRAARRRGQVDDGDGGFAVACGLDDRFGDGGGGGHRAGDVFARDVLRSAR